MALGLVLAVSLAACARKPEARYETAYPGQPVQTVVGTGYAATPGLPMPPRNAEGVVPAPAPRYLGETKEASSMNLGRP